MSTRLFLVSVVLLCVLGSVFAETTFESILTDHNKISEPGKKVFEGETLVYVTPWNRKGYEISKHCPSKFTYISPTWYNFRPKPDVAGKTTQYDFQGDDAVDTEWLEAIKSSSPSPKILPRFSVGIMNEKHISDIIKSFSLKKKLIGKITEEVKKHNYDGIVLEISGAEMYMYDFVSEVSKEMKALSKMLILVIPPIRERMDITSALPQLEKIVDRFSLMTYDYSSPLKPGPNSPIDWVRDNLKRMSYALTNAHTNKILLGINFYGNDYTKSGGGSAIVGHSYLQLIKDKKPTELKWNPTYQEHIFEYDRTHIVYYPTIESIQNRLKIAKEYNVGISIWEIGQGLDYWFDLL